MENFLTAVVSVRTFPPSLQPLTSDFLLLLTFPKILKMDRYNRTAHEIDYRIFGEEMQCVEIELDPQETAVAESGAFMMMDDGIQMETIFGDGAGSKAVAF